MSFKTDCQQINLCLKDGEGRWLLANTYDLNLFGLDGVDYIGKTDAELAPYSDFYRDALLTCMESDNETWEAKEVSRGEETIPKPDGNSIIFDITKIPLFNPDGSRQALVVVGHDVTECKRHEAAIVRSKEEWEKTFNAISDIITIPLLFCHHRFRFVSANFNRSCVHLDIRLLKFSQRDIYIGF